MSGSQSLPPRLRMLCCTRTWLRTGVRGIPPHLNSSFRQCSTRVMCGKGTSHDIRYKKARQLTSRLWGKHLSCNAFCGDGREGHGCRPRRVGGVLTRAPRATAYDQSSSYPFYDYNDTNDHSHYMVDAGHDDRAGPPVAEEGAVAGKS